MKQLMNLRFFSLLTETSKDNCVLTKLEDAYEEFAVTLLEKLQKETNVTQLYYNLGFVRLELLGFRDIANLKNKKKCIKNYNQGYIFD